MSAIKKKAGASARTDVDAAIAALPADDLREIVCDLPLELDDRAHARAVGSIVARAARGVTG